MGVAVDRGKVIIVSGCIGSGELEMDSRNKVDWRRTELVGCGVSDNGNEMSVDGRGCGSNIDVLLER